MIAILIAAATTLTAPPPMVTHSIRRPSGATPCQAVPSLCSAPVEAERAMRLSNDSARRPSSKMDAYGYDARPCRLVGNFDCPKRASRRIFRLGEPLGETLRHSFGFR